MRRNTTLLTLGLAASLALSSLVSHSAPQPVEKSHGHGAWRLVQAENFNKPLRPRADSGWFPNKDEAGTAYDVDAYDNDGEYFQTFGGEAFASNLAQLDLYRRSYVLGRGGWLTVELAARDRDGDAVPDNLPAFRRTRARGLGSVGTFDVPDHNSAVVLRSTNPLPKEYRVEVKLRQIDMGGQRGGSWNHGGRRNDYTTTGHCKTNVP